MKITYEGFEIEFLEYSEKWRLDQRDFPSLKAAKEHIDELKLKGRRVNTPVLIQESYARRKFVPATATLWDGASVWVKHKSDGRRTKELAANTLLDTPEAHQALAEAKALFIRAQALKDDADKILDNIPRITQT